MTRQRIRLFLAALIALLLVALIVIQATAPDLTAGIREITNRDRSYYETLVSATLQADTP